MPGQELAARNAWIVAVELPFLLVLFWRWSAAAGFAVTSGQRVRQLGWVAAIGVSLVLWHRVAPWELCGVLATGPLLALRLLLADPPRDMRAWRTALWGAAPYLLLAALLLCTRLWREAPASNT